MSTTHPVAPVQAERTTEDDVSNPAQDQFAHKGRRKGNHGMMSAAAGRSAPPSLVALARELGRAAARQEMARRRHRGLSLIEMAILLALAALVLAALMRMGTAP